MVRKMCEGIVMVLALAAVLTLVAGCTSDDRKAKQQSIAGDKHIGLLQQQDHTNYVDDHILVAEQAANKIRAIPGVVQADVLLRQRNAYVAVVFYDTQARGNHDVGDQITAKVKSTDPQIQDVFISAHPEFVNLVHAYVTDVQQGRPVAGFFTKFDVLLPRIFPNSR